MVSIKIDSGLLQREKLVGRHAGIGRKESCESYSVDLGAILGMTLFRCSDQGFPMLLFVIWKKITGEPCYVMVERTTKVTWSEVKEFV